MSFPQTSTESQYGAPASWSSGPCLSLALPPASPTFCHLSGPQTVCQGPGGCCKPTQPGCPRGNVFWGGQSLGIHQQCPFYPTTGAFVLDAEHGCSKVFLSRDRVYPASHPCFLFQGSSPLVILLRRPAVLSSAAGVWAALGQTSLVRASPLPRLSGAFLGPCLAKCGP